MRVHERIIHTQVEDLKMAHQFRCGTDVAVDTLWHYVCAFADFVLFKIML